MDPQACWHNVCSALSERLTHPDLIVAQRAEILECLEALAEWVRRGGFLWQPNKS